MITDWSIYYQKNKHLPLKEVMANYKQMLLEFNEQMTLITQQSATMGSGPGGSNTSVPPDLIYSALSVAGKSAFDATAVGNFFNVSAADYASVFASVTGATKYAMNDSQLAESNDAWSNGYAFTLPAATSTIPASSYVIGFAAKANAGTGTITPLISTTFTGAYSAVANSPTFTVGVPAAIQYYIRRNPQTPTVAISYLAMVSDLDRIRGTTVYANFFATSPYNSWTPYNAAAPVQQFISTTTKCWV